MGEEIERTSGNGEKKAQSFVERVGADVESWSTEGAPAPKSTLIVIVIVIVIDIVIVIVIDTDTDAGTDIDTGQWRLINN